MRLSSFRFFDLLYNAYHAWPRFYDGLSQLLSFGQWEKWQNSVFEDLTGKKILEIGVGPGSLLIRMAKKGFTVIGAEIRKGMAYEARRRVKATGLDIDILYNPYHKMPFKDEAFDCIVMTFVLAEIKNLDAAIVEMKRVLKKGGKIIIVAGGMPQDQNLVARLLFKMVAAQTSLKLERDNRAYFEKYGFAVTRKDFGPFNMVNKIVAIKQ